jgi:methyl-accepting chemotaxis protein
MTLRVKLILVTSAVVLVLFGISEWLSYRHTTALLERHEAILVETADHAVALERLNKTRNSMFVSVTTVRLLHAFLTLIISVALLNYVWYRVIYRPVGRLLGQINIMGRGTWKSALPVHRNDEIGQLTAAFNELGEQLTSTFRSINSSSKLSALALVGNRLIREINTARAELLATTHDLQRNDQDPVSRQAALSSLLATYSRLKQLETQFQIDFDREVLHASADSRTDPVGNASPYQTVSSADELGAIERPRAGRHGSRN